MRERERLEDFRGGHVACRGCKRLLLFQPGELLQVQCCGLLYSPEPGPVDLVIYDRIEPGEADQAQVMPAQPPQIIAPSAEELAIFGAFPDEDEAPVNDAEVEGMLASAQEIAERAPERQKQLRQRGPRYD